MDKKDEIRLKMKKEIPVSFLGFYERALNGSKANAIKAKCLECCCNVREEIRSCEVYTCPLWEVRPYKSDK